MLVRTLLQRCIHVAPDMPAQQALNALENDAVDYAVVSEGRKTPGFVTRKSLRDSLTNGGEIRDYMQPFAGQIHEETDLAQLQEQLCLPALVFDASGGCSGVLDGETLLVSILRLERENKELAAEIDAIINFSSDEIYVTDGKAITLRVNKAFEENSGIPLEMVIGKNVIDLEAQGYFKPSVTRLVMEKQNKVTVLQEYKNKRKVLVTGTPVFDDSGAISRVIINTRDTNKLNILKAELEEIENLKNRYYQELLNMNADSTTDHIVAYSKSMTELLKMAKTVAEVDSTVLLLGETGVGKGLIARFIHENSPRKNNLFININCGAIPENLLESELFGYEPGAFTGAHRKGKVGKIELAHKGTLFLDEVGDLPSALQVKLLHVIQEGTITRIGGTKEIRLDVHFLAATNKSLAAMVQNGTFREDLFYRLHVIPLEIPPLRQRSEDIEPLTQKFLQKFNQKYGKNKSFSPAALSFLTGYSWPGNVRELENLIERLVIVVGEEVIEPQHLPETIKMANLANGWGDAIPGNLQPLEKIKEDVEKQILTKLYHQFKNTYKIAEFLKINQSTVVRKLNKYNITKE